MDGETYEQQTQPSSPGRLYYAIFIVFILASTSLALWAFVTLAVSR